MLAPGARKSPTPRSRVGNSPAAGGAGGSAISASPVKPVLTGAPRIKIPSVATSTAGSGSNTSRTAGGTATARGTALTGNTSARPLSSGSISARPTNTARSASAQSTGSAKATTTTTATTSGPNKPFHRPLLSSLHPGGSKVPITRMTDARTSSNSGGGAVGGDQQPQRSSSVHSNEASKVAAAARITRSPSPAKIPQRRCRHCSSLVTDLEKHAAECPAAPLPCGLRDSEPESKFNKPHSRVCGFVARGANHLREHREKQCPFRLVPCQNARLGCTAQVSICSMEQHVDENCNFAVYVCEFCKAPVTRGAHEAHVSTECPGVRVLCPLGCGRDVLRSEVDAHIRQTWSEHMKSNGGNSNGANGNAGSSSSDNKMPPESARRVADTLLGCLAQQTAQAAADKILSASDDLDANPLAGSVDSLEHCLFVGQSVLRSISLLGSEADSFPQHVKQQLFEIVERRAELAKTRLGKHSGTSTVASGLKTTLDTSLGQVALKVCE